MKCLMDLIAISSRRKYKVGFAEIEVNRGKRCDLFFSLYGSTLPLLAFDHFLSFYFRRETVLRNKTLLYVLSGSQW